MRVFLPFVIVIFTFWCTNSFAQGEKAIAYQEITVKKSILLGQRYYQSNKRLKSSYLRESLQSNEQAYSLYKKTTTPRVIADIFGFAGGFTLGWQLAEGSKPGGGEVLPVILGCAGILAGLMVEANVNKNRRIAVGIYNKGLKNGSSSLHEDVNLSFTGNGIRLTF
jgi:hypothetical protein